MNAAGRWDYHDMGAAKPFVHPVHLPSGPVISADHPPSHPWHHGLWFAIKFVNGDNFWEETDPHGVVRPVAARPGRLAWVAPDDAVVMTEERAVVAAEPGADCYAIDWTITLAAETDVVLDREPYNGIWGGYSGLAFRGRGDWTGTRLLCADGSAAERLEGVAGDWLDLSGPIDGSAGGVAFFDPPANPRHPVPWYASTKGVIYGDEWGNFVNAALLWNEPLTLDRGERLDLRYRVLVHDDVWGGDRLDREYRHYCDGLA
jgi:Family of unknown function (DUF6807)